MTFISLSEYAKRHGKNPSRVRVLAETGRLPSAQKVGRNWIVDEREHYPDDGRLKGVRVSYDYTELLDELEEELADGSLTLSDSIQVLRSKNRGYQRIVDWYYDDLRTRDALARDVFDSSDEIQEKQELLARYEKDLPRLEKILVSDCLSEMKARNKII